MEISVTRRARELVAQHYFPLSYITPPEWVLTALSDFDAFLVDHASCERKAVATGLSFIAKHPDKAELVDAMIGLTRDEMEHFHQVYRIMRERGLRLSPNEIDPYVAGLLELLRNGSEEQLLDRLLIFGVIEARGCERFALVSDEMRQRPELADYAEFYAQLAIEEAKHFGLFVKHAQKLFSEATVFKRAHELIFAEEALLKRLPWRAALH